MASVTVLAPSCSIQGTLPTFTSTFGSSGTTSSTFSLIFTTKAAAAAAKESEEEQTEEEGSGKIELVDCGLCLDQVPKEKIVKGFRCKHHGFCQDCTKRMFEHHITEGTLEDLVCPITTCRKRQVLPSVIQDLVEDPTFDRFLTVSLNRALDSMIDLVWCPKCNTAVIGDNQGYGHCTQCKFCFCLHCNQLWHTGRCGEETVAVIKDTDIQGSGSRRVETTLDDKVILAMTTKRCPNCLVHIEKNGGCDHMHCRRCNTHFQWSGAPPSLYLTQEIKKRIEKEEKRKQAEAKKAEKLQRDMEKATRPRFVRDPNTRNCPGCRRSVQKETNSNFLSCTCGTRFCFECGASIKGTLHFAPPSTCKQHSPLKHL